MNREPPGRCSTGTARQTARAPGAKQQRRQIRTRPAKPHAAFFKMPPTKIVQSNRVGKMPQLQYY